MKQLLREEDLPTTGEFRPSADPRGDQPGQERDARRRRPRRGRPQPPRADRRPARPGLPGAAARRSARSTSTTSCSRPSGCSRRRPTSSPATRTAGATSTSTSTRTRTGPSTCGSGRSPRATTTSPSSATTTSRSTRGAGADLRNILDFERDEPTATVVKLEQNYRSTQLILDAAHAVVSRNAARKDKKLWTGQRRRPADPALRGLQRGGGGRVDRPPGRGADRRVALDPHPAGRRRRGAAQPARHRGDVPDERPEPGDRGGVPALRDPLPAHRRDPLLPAARGEGRARLPADPAQRQRRGRASSGSSTCRPGGSARRRSRRSAGRSAAQGSYWAALEAAGAGTGRRASPPGHGPRWPTSSSSSGRCAPGSACCPLPELLDAVLERSGYRAMLADGSEEGEDRWNNLLELRSVTTRYDDLEPERRARPAARGDGPRRRPGFVRGRGRRGHPDHPPRRQGPRVPGRLHRRARGGRLPAQPGARRRARARGGAPARLRRDHPGEAPALPVPRLAPRDVGDGRGVGPVALPARDPGRADGRAVARRRRERARRRAARSRPRLRGPAGEPVRDADPGRRRRLPRRAAGGPARRRRTPPAGRGSGRAATWPPGATPTPAVPARDRSAGAAGCPPGTRPATPPPRATSMPSRPTTCRSV